MKKGFTLIELLAVIIVLAIIATIATNVVMSSIKDARNGTYVVSEKSMMEAADLYVTINNDLLPSAIGEIKLISLNDLNNQNLIKPIIDPNSNQICDGYVILKKDIDETKTTPYLKCGTNYQTNGYSKNSLTNVEVLVVAGGGGGGSSVASSGGGGGGGAGGLIHNANYILSSNNVSLTVGNGGTRGTTNLNQSGTNGENSTFGTLIAIGGGGGAKPGNNGLSGGSGGGGGYNGYTTPRAGGTQTPTQGNPGGSTSQLSWAGGAGGGGYLSAGGDNLSSHTGGNGGSGIVLDITGESITYANGGRGGGGASAIASLPNTGKGGDGAYSNQQAANGASGIVVVKYLGHQKANGGEVIEKDGYTIHIFKNLGTSNFKIIDF